MHLRHLVVALAGIALTALPTGAAEVRGTVTMKEKGGAASSDLAAVVVYLEGAAAPVAPKRTTITMRGKAFEPRVLVVPVGATIDFPNADPILHNVFSATKGNSFDLQLYKAPKSASWTFREAGIVNVYCNIHPQMGAVVIVRDNPWYASVRPDGGFAIEGVPAGKYTLTAWHDRGGQVSQSVVVGAQGADVTLALDASRYKWVAHRNKFGRAYSTGERY